MKFRALSLVIIFLSLIPRLSYAEEVKPEGKGKAMKIIVTSRAFKDGGMIPDKYSGRGEDISPPISWSMIPKGAKSVALICDDPDAPTKVWVHWVIFNIPPDEGGIAENRPKKEELSKGALQGLNSSGLIGYEGPFPPSGVHRYYFRVYALDTMLDLEGGITREDLDKAMEGHILGTGELMGKFER